MNLNSLLLALAALVAVLGLILLAQRAARWGGLPGRVGGGGGRLALVESVSLDPRRKLTLVRCDDRHVLMLTGGAQDVVVGWMEPAHAPGGAP